MLSPWTTARCLLPLLTLVLAVPLAAQQRLKVFISVDMEGVAGVVSDQQLGPTGGRHPERRDRIDTGGRVAVVHEPLRCGHRKDGDKHQGGQAERCSGDHVLEHSDGENSDHRRRL